MKRPNGWVYFTAIFFLVAGSALLVTSIIVASNGNAYFSDWNSEAYIAFLAPGLVCFGIGASLGVWIYIYKRRERRGVEEAQEVLVHQPVKRDALFVQYEMKVGLRLISLAY